MLTELGKFMEEMLTSGMKRASDIGEILSRTPFQAAWRREPGGLYSLLREIPNVELVEDPDGTPWARLMVLPEADPRAVKSIFVDGSHIDAGPGFGGWAALLPGGKLMSGGGSGCLSCYVEAEAILFALEHSTGDVCIYSDNISAIENLQRPLLCWEKKAVNLEFQIYLDRYSAGRRGRKVVLTHTKSETTWQHRTVHRAARQAARIRHRYWVTRKTEDAPGEVPTGEE